MTIQFIFGMLLLVWIFAGYNNSVPVFDLHRPDWDFERYSTLQGNKEGQAGTISAVAFSPTYTGMLVTGSYSQTSAIYREDMELLFVFHSQEGSVLKRWKLSLYWRSEGDENCVCVWSFSYASTMENADGIKGAPTIQSFRLHFDPTGVGDVVEKWIKNSIIKEVEELDLDFVQGSNPFELCSDLLNIESLKILKLCYCTVHLPPKLQGLSLLNTIVFKKLDVTSTIIETVFNNCLLLESMDITQCRAIGHLNIYAQNLNKFKVLRVGDCGYISQIYIDAPTLQLFHYFGHTVIFKFVHVLKLNDVILNFLSLRFLRRENPVHVYDLFNLNVFSTSATFLETLFSETVDRKLKKPQSCFWHLKEFQLFMEGANFCNVYDIASFLKSCPRLERIFIDLNEFSFANGYYWEAHHKELVDKQLLQPYNDLKLIKLTGFKFQKHEHELVKYLLQKAKFLETLVLVTPKNSSLNDYAADAQRYNDVFSSWKASKIAQIKLFDYFDDKSFVNPQHSKIVWF